MKKILTKRGITIGVVAVLIAVATLISIKVTRGNSGFLSNAYEALMKPVKSVMSSIADELEHIYGYMYEYDKLVAENEELKTEIADLQREYREYTEISEENERLRELQGLGQRHSDFGVDTATIISWSASNWSSSFTISKGSSNSEVAVGDCIMTERGELVGQVTEVGVTTSTAVTIIDTTFSAGALIESSGGAAIVTGDFTLMKENLLKLGYIPEGTEILTGDTIITSGKGGVLPKGLVVGYVQDVVTDETGLEKYGVVQPAVSLNALTNVYILTDFEVSE